MEIEEYYEQYVKDVYRYILSMCGDPYLAEDVTQDTFIKAFQSLGANPPMRVKPWLFTIAYRVFVDNHRKTKRIHPKDPSDFRTLADSVTTEDQAVDRSKQEVFYELLQELPDNQRQAILLVDVNELSIKEASQVLSIKENTCKSHLFRGRTKIKKWIHERWEEDDG
ncbi:MULTISPECIES: RNA polymerase sigma factor [Pontibacillus]|uniref:RNA polymerase sigma factor n=1 Tax=Pontibacillus chungwhensis TaxID=265426 RepID=A0ABY8UXZ3_9BACI|nr:MULTISPECIES: sigma-70 family RNA polymerase sigma factor [Pontibacillus]MCD5325405.1 sigma-70 family RNA polymerase sigma factor [Pontibacillus sp. HN14]WIF98520.1 sigma-70 family RNA polymerase sigma factor [Pontibacillus chungwhensis]